MVNKDNRHHKDNNVNLGWSNNLGRKIEYFKHAIQKDHKVVLLYNVVQTMNLGPLQDHNQTNVLNVVQVEEIEDKFLYLVETIC